MSWGSWGWGSWSSNWGWGSNDWWRDPDQRRDPQSSSSYQSTDWWRDPAASIADDHLTQRRAAAAEEHGGPSVPGAYFGGEREGYQVANFPRRGQERGRSGNEQELHHSHHVFSVNVPLNLEGGRVLVD